jgi:hypothetical protein
MLEMSDFSSLSMPSAVPGNSTKTSGFRFLRAETFLPSLAAAFKDAYKDAVAAGQKRAKPRLEAKKNLQTLVSTHAAPSLGWTG